MSFSFDRDVNYLDGMDYTELIKFGRFTTLTLKTEKVEANGTEQFKASTEDDIVASTDIVPDNGVLPGTARVVAVKFNVRSGSTDSSIKVFQSNSYDEIDQVVFIESLDIDTTPETYILGAGIGTPFTNKEGENQVYFEVDENSGTASEYDIELNWLNIPR